MISALQLDSQDSCLSLLLVTLELLSWKRHIACAIKYLFRLIELAFYAVAFTVSGGFFLILIIFLLKDFGWNLFWIAPAFIAAVFGAGVILAFLARGN
jgi:hypothetical protein